MNIASYIDHTVLRPTTGPGDIRQLCNEAIEFRFAAVCVPPGLVRLSRELLPGHPVKVATVIGFPFGYSVTAAKLAEIQQALADGADELDVVINLSAVKSGSWDLVEGEVRQITEKIHEKGKIVKIIIESGILSEEEIIQCCAKLAPIGVDFLKTSTGYAEKGASLEAVQLMRANLPSHIKIKASGGIKTSATAKMYIEAGVERIGTSSGVAIMRGEPADAKY